MLEFGSLGSNGIRCNGAGRKADFRKEVDEHGKEQEAGKGQEGPKEADTLPLTGAVATPTAWRKTPRNEGRPPGSTLPQEFMELSVAAKSKHGKTAAKKLKPAKKLEKQETLTVTVGMLRRVPTQ